MKHLYIIRHAKSSWDAGILNDHDRTLNNQGHNEANAMAKLLLAKNVLLQQLVSSTAIRAFTTANYFANAFKIALSDIVKTPNLYEAQPQDFYSVIGGFNNDYNSIAIFSHNPGISEFVNELTTHKINDMPTCGVFAIRANCTNWEGFKNSKKDFVFFEQP